MVAFAAKQGLSERERLDRGGGGGGRSTNKEERGKASTVLIIIGAMMYDICRVVEVVHTYGKEMPPRANIKQDSRFVEQRPTTKSCTGAFLEGDWRVVLGGAGRSMLEGLTHGGNTVERPDFKNYFFYLIQTAVTVHVMLVKMDRKKDGGEAELINCAMRRHRLDVLIEVPVRETGK